MLKTKRLTAFKSFIAILYTLRLEDDIEYDFNFKGHNIIFPGLFL